MQKKIWIFFPWRVDFSSTGSIHTWGVWRIDKKTQLDLESLLELQKNNYEISLGLNFRDAIFIDNKIMLWDFCMNDLDAYFWYCDIDRNIWSYDLDILKALTKTTKVLPDPYKFEIWLDKFHSHLEISFSWVKVAETVLVSKRTFKQIKPILEEWWSAVLKPRRWWFGKGVKFISSYDDIRDLVDYIASENGDTKNDVYMLERYYQNNLSKWVSITIIWWEIMYGYRKKPSKRASFWWGIAQKIYDEWEIGWEVDGCEVTSEQIESALKAYFVLWMGIIWFDFIVTDNGQSILIDENTFPWFYRHIFEEVGKNPAEEIYKYILSEITNL